MTSPRSIGLVTGPLSTFSPSTEFPEVQRRPLANLLCSEERVQLSLQTSLAECRQETAGTLSCRGSIFCISLTLQTSRHRLSTPVVFTQQFKSSGE